MLEEKIERLTAEVIKLREAIEKGGGATAGGATAGKGKDAPATGGKGKAAAKSKFTADQIKAAVMKVKDDISAEKAKEIIAAAGASGLAELITKTDTFDSVMAACEEALAGDSDDDDAEDGLGGL